VHGHYHGQIVRDGVVIDEFDCPNLCVDEGLNSLLNVYFDAATQISTWYMGLFEGNYTPIAGVTAATIAAAATETTAYNETLVVSSRRRPRRPRRSRTRPRSARSPSTRRRASTVRS